MVDKITSVKINEEKWEILKNKGYKLQDILNNAFDLLLEISSDDNLEFVKLKESKEKELQSKIMQKEHFIKKIDSEIKDIEISIQILNEKIEKNNRKQENKEKHLEELRQRNSDFNKIRILLKTKHINELMENDEINDFCAKYMEGSDKKEYIKQLIREVHL